MSQGTVEVVRQPIAVSARSRRRLEERLALRFPRVTALLAHAVWRLAPRSRLRMAALGRAARLGYEAANRDDMEATFIFYHRDCESILPAELANMGDPAPRGREERVRWQRSWQAGWGGFRFEPEELIDLGVRQVVIGRVRGRGQSSGVAVDSEWAVLFTSRAGLVTREEIFMDHRKALEAAGLGE